MIFILRKLLLRSMITFYVKVWSTINVMVMVLSLSGYYLMSLAKESVIIDNSALVDYVKTRTDLLGIDLFCITDKRLNNIIWGSL